MVVTPQIRVFILQLKKDTDGQVKSKWNHWGVEIGASMEMKCCFVYI